MNRLQATTTKKWLARLASVGTGAVILVLAGAAQAAVPGVTGTGAAGTFNLVASQGYITQPDGDAIYSWGYGCATGSRPSFVPYSTGVFCPIMQIPRPTLVGNGHARLIVLLRNNRLAIAGNTS